MREKTGRKIVTPRDLYGIVVRLWGYLPLCALSGRGDKTMQDQDKDSKDKLSETPTAGRTGGGGEIIGYSGTYQHSPRRKSNGWSTS